MDFLKVKNVLKLYWRIGDCDNRTVADCKGCPLNPLCSGVSEFGEYSDEKLVAAVDFLEEWDANRPKKTRQSEFLKIVPNAKLNENGIIDMCPDFDNDYNQPCNHGNCYGNVCDECIKRYWLTEIEED